MKSRKFFNALFIFLIALNLAGCAGVQNYREPVFSKDEGAILEAVAPIWIISIDGQKVSNAGLHDDRKIRVAHGNHFLEVAYFRSTIKNNNPSGYARYERRVTRSNKIVQLSISARKGRTYVVYADVTEKTWRPFIRDFVTLDSR